MNRNWIKPRITSWLFPGAILLATQPFLAQEYQESFSGKVLVDDRPPGDFADKIVLELVVTDRPTEPLKALVSPTGEYRFYGLFRGSYILRASAPRCHPASTRIDLLGANRLRGITTLTLQHEMTIPEKKVGIAIVAQNELRAPAEARKWRQKAEGGLASGDLEMAFQACERALRLYPDYAVVHYLAGNILIRKQQIAAGIEHYQKAVAADCFLYEAYWALAEIFRGQEDFPPLRDVADRWKKVQPFDSRPHYYSALVWYEAGEFQQAVEEASVANRFPHEKLPHLPLLLANCYLKLKEPHLALLQLQQFLDNSPDDPMAPQARRTLEELDQIH
jgi:tetratricopeptide (TPR) repeat protein